MSRAAVAILCVIALLIGAAAGAYTGFSYGASIVSDIASTNSAARSTADIASYVRLLEFARGSRDESAIGILEARLDGELVLLGTMPRKFLPASAPSALRRAAEYRAKYPHASGSPAVEEAIQRAFAIAKEGT